MKKPFKRLSTLLVPLLVISLSSCGPKKTSSQDDSKPVSETSTVVEDYYTINVSGIATEMLVDTELLLNPTFTNLGEAATPNYKVEITLEGTRDVTSEVYNAETKMFAPTEVGTYEVTFTVLTEDGEVLVVSGGTSFSAKVTINVVIQSFEPLASAGPDVTIDEEGDVATITFGDSYLEGDKMISSGQYKVTGLTFQGNYSITYKLENVRYSESYHDPAFYFGWTRNTIDAQDDCFKLSTGDGTIATWIWGGTGLANLSSNLDHGWFHDVWFNAPGSVSDNQPITDEHFITFERFISEDGTATYGIKYDGVAFNFLEIGENYTDLLSNVWIEAQNTSATLSVYEYGVVSDTVSPEVVLSYPEYTTEDTIHLGGGVSITDDGDYGDLIVPKFTVLDPKGEEVIVTQNSFEPALVGDYEVTCNIKDIAGNTASATTTITVTEPAVTPYVFNLDETTPVARTNSGVILYYDVTLDGEEVPVDSVEILKGNTLETAVDVTAKTYEIVESADKSLAFEVFTPKEAGMYLLKLTVDDTVRTKQISVTDSCEQVYGQKYWETGYQNFIMGRDTYIYRNVTGDQKVGKVGNNFARKTNWTLSFEITDLKFSAQGKFMMTIGASKADGGWGGWEDLAIGGNVNDDLWGYETATVGVGWQTYQWRSNWQNPTTEFMPDPTDPTIGCGRPADAYTQYGTGTHSYKIVCSTAEDGVVTYSFFIDDMPEAVHILPSAHNEINSTDILQFSSHSMNGIITNFRFE